MPKWSNHHAWPGYMNGVTLPGSGFGIGRVTPSGKPTTLSPMALQCSSSATASSGVCIGITPAGAMRSAYWA